MSVNDVLTNEVGTILEYHPRGKRGRVVRRPSESKCASCGAPHEGGDTHCRYCKAVAR